METQKKYHNLVLLDENNATKQFVMKKLTFIFLLFLFGIVIGALFISFMHNKNKLTTQVISVIEPLPRANIADSLQAIVPSSLSELQGITAITPSLFKTDGCSVESLGRNLSEGCSVDDYVETPIDTKPDNSETDVTPLDGLIILEENINDAGRSVNEENAGVTNILDLQ
jgi:hypothetical protein